METDLNSQLEQVILERRCPDCGDDNLYFLPHYPDEPYSVECDTCGWEESFLPALVAEVRENTPDSSWDSIHNWQS